MSTLSVPLNEDQATHLKRFLAQGSGSSKAGLLRKAWDKFVEDQAVEAVLRAAKETPPEGDLDELAAKI